MTLYSLAFSFFILMDAIGNIPIFLSLLKGNPPKRQQIIIFREMVIALAVMAIFYFLGELLLGALHVTQETLSIAGGIVLFLIALKMIFPPPKETNGHAHDKEPFIVPIAVPLIAGPGVLASLMLYSKQTLSVWTVLGAVLIAWILSLIILLSSSFLQRLLGPRAMSALERLMGLILTLMAVQMVVEGVQGCFCA